MRFEIKLKNSDEAIGSVHENDLQSAKQYFIGRKQMSESQFDNLYEVVQKKEKKIKKSLYVWKKLRIFIYDLKIGYMVTKLTINNKQ